MSSQQGNTGRIQVWQAVQQRTKQPILCTAGPITSLSLSLQFVEISSRLQPSTMSISEDDFMQAAKKGQLDIVNQAIDQGVNINCANVSRGVSLVVSRTPLIVGIPPSAITTAINPHPRACPTSYILIFFPCFISFMFSFPPLPSPLLTPSEILPVRSVQCC